MTAFNAQLALAVVAVAFGSGFPHGYTEVLSKKLPRIVSLLKLNESNIFMRSVFTKESFLPMIYGFGGVIGCILIPLVANRIGRKKGLIWNNGTLISGVILSILSKILGFYELLFLAQFLIGLSIWLAAGLSVIYLIEISPVEIRGAIAASYPLFVSIASSMGHTFTLTSHLGSPLVWHLRFAVCLVPPIFQICTLPFCVESPDFHHCRTNTVTAARALTELRTTTEIQAGLNELALESDSSETINLIKMFTTPAFRKPLFISAALNIAILWGFKVEFMFLPESFDVGHSGRMLQRIICVLAVSSSLLILDTVGRKRLIIIGLVGMILSRSLFSICMIYKESADWAYYGTIILFFIYFALYFSSVYTISWFLMCELSCPAARPMTTSIIFIINWVVTASAALLYFYFKNIFGQVFIIVSSILLTIMAVFAIYKLPETKGKSLDVINSIFLLQ